MMDHADHVLNILLKRQNAGLERRLEEETANNRKMFIQANRSELKAEEVDCAHKYLDDLLVPRANEQGRKYSLVGRIMHRIEQDAKESDKPLEVSAT